MHKTPGKELAESDVEPELDSDCQSDSSNLNEEDLSESKNGNYHHYIDSEIM